MAEIVVQFDESQCAPDGRSYVTQVWGQLAAPYVWEAWIAFLPTDGRDPIRTGRETEQFSRGDLRSWAAHLTPKYREDALTRALPYTSSVVPPSLELVPQDTLPDDEHTVFETNVMVRPVPVLDPFAVYRQNGTYTMRQELRSLDAGRLQDIIVAYEIPDLDTDDMLWTFEDALAERIVADVQQRVGSNHLEKAGNEAHTRSE